MKRLVPFRDSILGQLGRINAITLSGAVAGFLGLSRVLAEEPEEGMFLLLCAGLADSIDGPLARRTKRTELRAKVGQHLDSLCDLSSFGVIPAAMGLAFGLRSPGEIAVLAAFLAAAALRLAYFDSLPMASEGEQKHFVGLPTTQAALVIPLTYLGISLGGAPTSWLIYAYAALAVAMVAPIRIPKSRGVGLVIPAGAAILLMIVYGLASLGLISLQS